MKGIGSLMFTALLACGAAAAQPVEPLPPAAHSDEAGFHLPHRYKGTVELVDPEKGILVVRNRRGDLREFSPGASAKITEGGRSVSLGEISRGDRVSVTYKGAPESPQVERVKILDK